MATVASTLPHARRLPLSRDQMMMLMVAINEIFLGVDIYLAHSVSGTIVPREWIPIMFGPLAGVMLLIAGIIALRQRPLATVIAVVVSLGSICVGLLGAYFHVIRAVLPYGPAGHQITVNYLVWAPPVLAPLTFGLVGVLGISAILLEDPPDSGMLALPAGRRLCLPFSKTRAYLLWVGLGILATLISSVLDHARTDFQNPWLWVAAAAGIFAIVVTVALAVMDRPTRSDTTTFVGAMLVLILVGVVGAALHVNTNLTSQYVIVPERFIRGAPFLAPLLFSNMGVLGLIALMNPSEQLPRPRAR